jgi:hypothetical protein
VATYTERIWITVTTTQMATTTLAPIQVRQARAVNIVTVAEDIVASVMESGTTPDEATATNSQRLMAESGLANACSCKMVDPTAPVTSFYTLPPVVSYVLSA